MPTVQINYPAVVAAAFVAFVLGALWYSPVLFGKLWVKAHGYTEDKIQDMRKSAGRAYAVSAVCYLVMASALAVLVYYTNVTTPLQGIKLGSLVWLGFAFTIGLTGNMFSEKRVSTFFIDAGYQLVYLLFMGVILTVWR